MRRLGTGVDSPGGIKLSSIFRSMVFPPDVGEVDGGFRVFHFQSFKVLYDDARDGKVAEPLMVGRNDEPRRMFCAAP